MKYIEQHATVYAETRSRAGSVHSQQSDRQNNRNTPDRYNEQQRGNIPFNCPICSDLNFRFCEPPCRYSLGNNEKVAAAIVGYLGYRDYNHEYKLEIIYEKGEERLRFYDILRNKNLRKPSPNDYVKIFPSELLNLGYTFISKGKDLSINNFIMNFEPHDEIYVGPRIFKEIKCCKAFRQRMAHNNMTLN